MMQRTSIVSWVKCSKGACSMSGDTGIELFIDGLSFPTSLTFDQESNIYVAESGLTFGGAAPGGRVWRIVTDGTRTLIAEHVRHPVNCLVFHDCGLYVSCS